MTPKVEYRDGAAIAPDGFRARANGRWADDKLSFLDRYLAPALRVTTPHFAHRVYIDLFAGPGRFYDQRSKIFSPGGALRVLDAANQRANACDRRFTHAVLVNKDAEDHAALVARVDQLEQEGRLTIPRAQVQCIHADANVVVQHLARILPRNPYVFAFIDPEAPEQWPWRSCVALRDAVPKALDLYVLYPGMMAINRCLAWRGPRPEHALTTYFGTDAWYPIVEGRVTDADAPAMRQELEALYARQLEGLRLPYVCRPRRIRRTGEAELYTMFFASRKPVARKLVDWEMDTAHPQLGLFAG